MKPLQFLLLFLMWPAGRALAQCGPPPASNCQAAPASELYRVTTGNVDFTFDNFSEYIGGITYSGATVLRLKVLASNASCKWKLVMYIDNNPGGGTPASEWETLTAYGAAGAVPQLDLIQVKVYNGCNTPINSGVYQNFAAANGASLDIINDVTGINPAGSCATNVNGAGSYLTNYTEYTFTIDYRIVPDFSMLAGMYQFTIRFCLVEDV